MATLVTKKQVIAIEALRTVFALALAFGGAVWTARGLMADHETRITIHGGQLQSLQQNIVPRAEHQAHWEAMEHELASQHEDIRELRKILLSRHEQP